MRRQCVCVRALSGVHRVRVRARALPAHGPDDNHGCTRRAVRRSARSSTQRHEIESLCVRLFGNIDVSPRFLVRSTFRFRQRYRVYRVPPSTFNTASVTDRKNRRVSLRLFFSTSCVFFIWGRLIETGFPYPSESGLFIFFFGFFPRNRDRSLVHAARSPVRHPCDDDRTIRP